MRIRIWMLAGMLAMAGCDRLTKRADLVFLNGAEPETLDPALLVGQPRGASCRRFSRG